MVLALQVLTHSHIHMLLVQLLAVQPKCAQPPHGTISCDIHNTQPSATLFSLSFSRWLTVCLLGESQDIGITKGLNLLFSMSDEHNSNIGLRQLPAIWVAGH